MRSLVAGGEHVGAGEVVDDVARGDEGVARDQLGRAGYSRDFADGRGNASGRDGEGVCGVD